MIICNFIGTESPTSVKWFYKGSNKSERKLISEGTTANFNSTFQNKRAILTKTQPSLEDTGEYTCQFEIGHLTKPEIEPFAKTNLTGPSKFVTKSRCKAAFRFRVIFRALKKFVFQHFRFQRLLEPDFRKLH